MSLAVDIVKSLMFGFEEPDARTVVRSPLPRVSDQAWAGFTKVFINPANDITPHFRYGLFEFSVRRLCDLGLMANPSTVDNSGRMVWVAQWIPPLTLRRFLSSKQGQYETFVKSMLDYSRSIDLDPLDNIEGVKPSLSGLLAVAHRAGLQGLQTWVRSPEERVEFSHTTQFFLRANGIF